MELRVLDRNRELPGERGEQRGLVLGGVGPSCRIRRKQPDDLAAGHQRDRKRRAYSGLAGDRRDRREAWLPHDVGDLEDRPVSGRSERQVEQTVGDSLVRAREPAARRLLELAVAFCAEIDGDTVDAEQLGDPLDRGLERVGDRKLRSSLRNHLEQRPRPLELER